MLFVQPETTCIMKKYIVFFPALLFVSFNFYLSSLTWSEVRGNVGWVRNVPQRESFKVRHIVQYAPLSFSISYGFSRAFSSMSKSKVFILSVFLGTLDGAFEEVHQKFVPTRIPALIDIFWDFLGVLTGALLFQLLSRINQKFTFIRSS